MFFIEGMRLCFLPILAHSIINNIIYQLSSGLLEQKQHAKALGGGQKGPFYLWTRQKATFPPVSFLFNSKQCKTTYIPTLK
jgi:hypothetical protein